MVFSNINIVVEGPNGTTALYVRFHVLRAASIKFRIVFWDVLQRKIIVDDGGSTYI
jgi:hypothetical protein